MLKKQQAFVANYPFATIEPNVGVVPVPDERLERLAQIVQESDLRGLKPPIKPAVVNFVDIAGLVKGASEGAGLGNKFLSHIREVSVVAHVVRAFEDENILKEGAVDPKSDYDTIRTELLLADLESAKNQEAKIKSNDPLKPLLIKIIDNLDKGISISNISFHEEEKELVNHMFFLTAKQEIVVLNVAEPDYNPGSIDKMIHLYAGLLGVPAHKIIVICAKIEAELAALSEEEQKEYLRDLGFEASGLERLIQKAYEELGLISFLTAGEKEVRAWTIKKGSNALLASGEIHTDFMKKFIKAEAVSFPDFVQYNGWKGSREHGKDRLEGRDYIVRDGDVIEFKIGS
ncbi:MAG: redox-regulated ATPase YchF [Patescibacteria group bacterium]|nr:redox-regulated ATPase YchF [Patescibacteria group bacterium]